MVYNLQNINNVKNIKPSIWFLGFFVVLLMYKSQEILFVRNISESLFSIFCCLIIIFYALINNQKIKYFTIKQFLGIFLLILIYLYEFLVVTDKSFLNLIRYFLFLITTIIIYQFPFDIKNDLLRIFNFITKWMVLISIIGFCLMLLGFPFPNYIDTSDPYYTHVVYPVFNLNYTTDDLVPRFASTFLEPGHFATICVFLLYIGRFNMKSWDNIIYFIGVIISWSLAGYGLLVGAIGLYFIQKKKTGLLTLFIIFFIGLGIFSYNYNESDNLMYDYIYSRLEIDEDEGDIVGNNRSTKYFDSEFDKLVHSSEIIFGKGQKAFGNEQNAGFNITRGTAGIKRYFFIRGIVGTLLIISFLIFYYRRYKSKETLGFLIIFIVANMIRDYPLKQIWLYIYLMGLPYIFYLSKLKNQKNITLI